MDSMVTIPAAEYAMLRESLAAVPRSLAAVAQSKALLEQNAGVMTGLRQRVAHLEEQLAWFRRQVFGQKAERFIDPAGRDELPALPGLVMPEPVAPVVPPVAVPAHQRQATRGKGSCTLELPESLPRVEVRVDVPAAERTLPDGRAMVEIGVDRSDNRA
jgi:hypothetical protein